MKVAPVEVPVKEARVLPIKKEKPVEETPLKHHHSTNKSEKKSKKGGTGGAGGGKKSDANCGSNGLDDLSHTAMKIYLDKLKVGCAHFNTIQSVLV